MKGFLVQLSDEHRRKLEAYRSFAGLRSESEALRLMIDTAVTGSGMPYLITDGVLDTPSSGRIRSQAPSEGHGKRAPAPFKSRLKGEWKAP